MRKLSRTTIDQPGMAPYRRQIRAIMHQSGADARRAAAEAKCVRKNAKRLRDVVTSAGPVDSGLKSIKSNRRSG